MVKFAIYSNREPAVTRQTLCMTWAAIDRQSDTPSPCPFLADRENPPKTVHGAPD